MTRLRLLTRSELDDDQAVVWEQIVSSRAGSLELVGEEGGLIGPFNAFVHAPGVGRRLSALGAALRFQTSLDRRLIELATCTVGGYWGSEFELWAHQPMAIAAGVDSDVVDALGRGETPVLDREDEAIVHAVTTQLLGDSW